MNALIEVLRQIMANALRAKKERRAHKKQLKALKQRQLAEKRRIREEKKRRHKRANALRRSNAVGTMTIDLGKTIHRLWFRQAPQGQGRNAKQRRAQRKARHIKGVRSYKR